MRSSSISLFMTHASWPVSLLVNCSRLWNYKIATIPYTRRARLPRLTTPRNAPLRTTQQGTRMNAATLITAYYDAFNRGDREAMLSMLTDEVAHDWNQGAREVGREAFRALLPTNRKCVVWGEREPERV